MKFYLVQLLTSVTVPTQAENSNMLAQNVLNIYRSTTPVGIHPGELQSRYIFAVHNNDRCVCFASTITEAEAEQT